MLQPSTEVPGAVDEANTVYAMAREGRVPHLYRGEVPAGGFIHRPAVCGRVTVDRVAVPAETATGRICRWCERSGESATAREIHNSHDPESDGVRIYRGGHACRRCCRFIAFEGASYRITDVGVAPCSPSRIELRKSAE